MSVTGISTAKPTSMNIWLLGLKAAACKVSCGGTIIGKSATIINVPRDTTAPGGDKINAYHGLQGLPGIVEQLNQMMGIKISYAITTNFPGMIAMVDSLGGIDISAKDLADAQEGDKSRRIQPRLGGGGGRIGNRGMAAIRESTGEFARIVPRCPSIKQTERHSV